MWVWVWIFISWFILGGLGGAFWWLKSFGYFEDNDWLVILPTMFVGPLVWPISILIHEPWKWGSDPDGSWPGVPWKYKWDKPFWIK